MRPEDGRTVPEIRWNSVDLPAPFGPISACREPASTFERDRVDRAQLAVAATHARELQHRRHVASLSRRRRPPATSPPGSRYTTSTKTTPRASCQWDESTPESWSRTM